MSGDEPCADDDPASLELSLDTMRTMLDLASARALDHLAHVNEQPARGPTAIDTRALCEPAPEDGSDLGPLLDDLFERWIPASLTTNGPGYLAYIPGGGVFPAAIADLVQAVTNRFTGVRFAAPALVELEATALGWLRDFMMMPESTRGLFTTGGSMANFNGILCARERHLGADIRRGVLYTSTQSHHSVAKSARLAGIMGDRVRLVDVDESFRMRVDALERAIAQDRARDLVPFLVVSSAGTTNTGAIDPLDEIADVSAREGLWHHVDGAYGAFFHACPSLRPLLAGLSRCDSVTLDPHKGLFLPYGTGALLVRDGRALSTVHSAEAAYLPKRGDDEYDPSQFGPDLSRGFPGLRVWLTMKLLGARRLRAAIAEKRQLALMAAERIAQIPGIVIKAEPQLSLFAFHVAWPGSTIERENAATGRLLEIVAQKGRVLMTGCSVQEGDKSRFLARVCVLSFRTRSQHVSACVEDVTAATAEILRESRAST